MLKDPYIRPLLRALTLQLILIFFFGLVLDGGLSLQAFCYSSCGYWMGVILILVRRRASPTKGDLAFIRWGLLLVALLAVPAFLWVWYIKRHMGIIS